MNNKKLKVNGYKAVLKEKTIDVFKGFTVDEVALVLEIKETGNCIIRNNFQTIGWTDDKHLVFDIFNNSMPISTFSELFKRRY